jgi:hypothetical protein
VPPGSVSRGAGGDRQLRSNRRAVCARQAGRIRLPGTGELERVAFTSRRTQALGDPVVIARLRAAVVCDDSAAIHALDPEWAPWWCPSCRQAYCGDHWLCWDLFPDAIRGRCPRGTSGCSRTDALRATACAGGVMTPSPEDTRSDEVADQAWQVPGDPQWTVCPTTNRHGIPDAIPTALKQASADKRPALWRRGNARLGLLVTER